MRRVTLALLAGLATTAYPASAGAQAAEPRPPVAETPVPSSLRNSMDPRLLVTAEDRAAHAARVAARWESTPSREPYILTGALVGALVVPFVGLANSDHGLLGIGLIPYYLAGGALLGVLAGELLYNLVERPRLPPSESRQ